MASTSRNPNNQLALPLQNNQVALVEEVPNVQLRASALEDLKRAKAKHISATVECVAEVIEVFEPALEELLVVAPDRHHWFLKSKAGRNQKTISTMSVPGEGTPVSIATLKDLGSYIWNGKWLVNIFPSEDALVKSLNYYPVILECRKSGTLPPGWLFRLGQAELQAIKNVADQDLVNIICEKATKNEMFTMMVETVAKTNADKALEMEGMLLPKKGAVTGSSKAAGPDKGPKGQARTTRGGKKKLGEDEDTVTEDTDTEEPGVHEDAGLEDTAEQAAATKKAAAATKKAAAKKAAARKVKEADSSARKTRTADADDEDREDTVSEHQAEDDERDDDLDPAAAAAAASAPASTAAASVPSDIKLLTVYGIQLKAVRTLNGMKGVTVDSNVLMPQLRSLQRIALRAAAEPGAHTLVFAAALWTRAGAVKRSTLTKARSELPHAQHIAMPLHVNGNHYVTALLANVPSLLADAAAKPPAPPALLIILDSAEPSLRRAVPQDVKDVAVEAANLICPDADVAGLQAVYGGCPEQDCGTACGLHMLMQIEDLLLQSNGPIELKKGKLRECDGDARQFTLDDCYTTSCAYKVRDTLLCAYLQEVMDDYPARFQEALHYLQCKAVVYNLQSGIRTCKLRRPVKSDTDDSDDEEPSAGAAGASLAAGAGASFAAEENAGEDDPAALADTEAGDAAEPPPAAEEKVGEDDSTVKEAAGAPDCAPSGGAAAAAAEEASVSELAAAAVSTLARAQTAGRAGATEEAAKGTGGAPSSALAGTEAGAAAGPVPAEDARGDDSAGEVSAGGDDSAQTGATAKKAGEGDSMLADSAPSVGAPDSAAKRGRSDSAAEAAGRDEPPAKRASGRQRKKSLGFVPGTNVQPKK